MAALLLLLFLCSANIPTTDKLGNFQPLFPGPFNLSSNPKHLSTFMFYTGATTLKNNGGESQLVDLASALYSLPVEWGIFSRCYEVFSTGAKQIKMAPLRIVAPDSLPNKKHPHISKE
jgi:hypothetical protein